MERRDHAKRSFHKPGSSIFGKNSRIAVGRSYPAIIQGKCLSILYCMVLKPLLSKNRIADRWI